MAEGDPKINVATAGPGEGAKGGKKKFDPNALPEELKPVYQAMLADYTRKMQGMERERETLAVEFTNMNQAVQALQAQVSGYERAYAGGQPVQAAAAAQPAQTGAPQMPPFLRDLTGNLEGYDPFNPATVGEVVKSYVGAAIGQYHTLLAQEYQNLMRGLVEQQTHNYQLMKLLARDPDMNVEAVIKAAPQYGNNLEQAYRAVHESPKVWSRAKEADEMAKSVETMSARIKELEAKGTPTSILGGTAGPMPRTVAKGQAPRTYEEAAATVSPAEVVDTVGVGGPVAVTAGGQAGGGAVQTHPS